MTLKTLKDIRKDRIKYFKKKLESFGCPDSYLEQTAKSMALFLEKQDKQEATKWIKLWKVDFNISAKKSDKEPIKEKIKAFKYFFNITGGDLNQSKNKK